MNVGLNTTTVQEYINEKQINGSLLMRLQDADQNEQTHIAALVRTLRPSANTLQELLCLCDEICKRDNCALSTLFSEAEVHRILDSETLGRSDKQKQLRAILKRRRYPELSKIHDKIAACKQQILRDTGLKLELPKDLEGDNISLNMTFRTARECKVLAEKLSMLAEHPDTEQIFALLKGKL